MYIHIYALYCNKLKLCWYVYQLSQLYTNVTSFNNKLRTYLVSKVLQ